MSNLKPYTCPNCKNKLPFKNLFTLTNGSNVVCNHCGMVSEPEKMGSWYALGGFLSFVFPFKVASIYIDSFFLSLLIGLLGGIIYYTIILYYVYNNIRFHLKF